MQSPLTIAESKPLSHNLISQADSLKTQSRRCVDETWTTPWSPVWDAKFNAEVQDWVRDTKRRRAKFLFKRSVAALRLENTIDRCEPGTLAHILASESLAAMRRQV